MTTATRSRMTTSSGTATMMKGFQHVLFTCLSLMSWLLPRRGRPLRSKPRHAMHPLAYLDGLRGICALTIMTGHATHISWTWIPVTISKVPWLQFPIRGGHASVLIFFWISGYTTTYKLCGLMQMKRPDQFLDTLTSATFRRYMRLFLPPIPIILLTAIAVRTGITIGPKDKTELVSGNLLLFWLQDTVFLLNPFAPVAHFHNGASGSKLVEPLWSLSTEFRSSMIMYGFCAAARRLSTRTRKTLILSMLPFLLIWDASWSFMAFLGMWFSEMRQEKRIQQGAKLKEQLPMDKEPDVVLDGHDLTGKKYDDQTISPSRFHMLNPFSARTDAEKYQQLRQIGLLLSFLYSFVIIKDPYGLRTSQAFPHNYINNIIPPKWSDMSKMHLNLIPGVILLLWPLDQWTVLQRPLLYPFVQYLGELSFGIYVVNKPIIWTVFEGRYLKWVEKVYAPVSPYHVFQAIFPGWLMLAICVLWAAEGFRRIDMQVPKFCVWLETRLFETW